MGDPRRARETRRNLNGVVLINKPHGISSNAALRAVQRLFGAAKAGHTGTLDPLATGLLPACFGDATRFSHILLDAEKTYLARVRLGTTTATGDLEGPVTARAAVSATRKDVEAVLPRFTGWISQIPPMYSAIKQGGRPLYEIARAGGEVPRAARTVMVKALALGAMDGAEFELTVVCSKGTYVRVLAEDIGRELGCGACLAALERRAVGGLTLEQGAWSIADLEAMTPGEREGILLRPDALLAMLPRYDLDAAQARRIAHGQAVEQAGAVATGLARIYGPDRQFMGLAEVTGPGRIVPRRLVPQPASA